jgi:hypothetical protein
VSEKQPRPCWRYHEEPQPATCKTCYLFLNGTDLQKWAIARAAGVELPRVAKTSQKFKINVNGRLVEGRIVLGEDGSHGRVFTSVVDPNAKVVSEVPPCPHLGRLLTGLEREARGITHVRRWKYCLHESRPLGDVVCECQGCGPGCWGYPTVSKGAEVKTWAVGITTVPERRDTTLPMTLASLAAAGFPKPRLFVDGDGGDYSLFDVARRSPRIGCYGNWILSLMELYIRNPTADRYAVFQDDLVAVKGLRSYLDNCKYPDGKDGRKPGYWNLFTFLDSALVAKGNCGWVEGPMLASGADPKENWQAGRGALGLVFNRDAVQLLLVNRGLVEKPTSAIHPRDRVDGGVVSAMNSNGWREYVHGPSLLSHTGVKTSIQEPGKAGKVWASNADSFPGEKVDIRRLMHPSVAGSEDPDTAAV